MSDVIDATGGTGSLQTNGTLNVDAALCDWVYHRDRSDQGFSLSDIASNLRSAGIDIPRNQLNAIGLEKATDGFIYSLTDGFCASVVVYNGVYTIVYRGTDFPESISDADPGDINADLKLGLGEREEQSQAQDAIALAQFVLENLASNDVSKVHLTGQSLGGELACLASAATGISANVFAPAPFASALVPLAIETALYTAGLPEDGGRDDLRRPRARLQRPFPADVQPLSGRPRRLHARGRLGERAGREPGRRRAGAVLHAARPGEQPRGAERPPARLDDRLRQGPSPLRVQGSHSLADVRGGATLPGSLCLSLRRLPRHAGLGLQTCLVRFDINRVSVAAGAIGRPARLCCRRFGVHMASRSGFSTLLGSSRSRPLNPYRTGSER